MFPKLTIIEDQHTIKIYCGAELLHNIQKPYLKLHPVYENETNAIVCTLLEDNRLLTLLITQLREEGYFRPKMAERRR